MLPHQRRGHQDSVHVRQLREDLASRLEGYEFEAVTRGLCTDIGEVDAKEGRLFT